MDSTKGYRVKYKCFEKNGEKGKTGWITGFIETLDRAKHVAKYKIENEDAYEAIVYEEVTMFKEACKFEQ